LRGRLAPEEREDFHSFAIFKLMENDYSRIRKFEGRSSFRSFLSVAVGHLLLDFWANKGGRRRPSSAAQLLAPEGVWLERYLRDGYTVTEAIRLVRTNHDSRLSEDELYQVTVQLPARSGRPKQVAESLLGDVPSSEPSPERLLEEKRTRVARERLEAALEDALCRLPADERVFVRMRFEEGSRINEIGRAFHIPDKAFYRRFQRTLRQLRSSLEEAGLDAGCLKLYREADEAEANFSRRTV
jgi:RNA polymerase sigma factor (sigma-70 family)